jgi:hypothetical protein
MKTTLIAIICGLTLALGVADASATTLTIGDARYIGLVKPGAPSDETSEVTYIAALLALAPGASVSPCGTQTSCDRIGSTIDVSGFPAPTTTGFFDGDATATGIDVTGFTYLLAKYDAEKAGDYVWYVAGLSTVDIPATAGDCGKKGAPAGCGLSHYDLFNPGDEEVPDGGATIGLLGLGLLGLGYIRRRVF